MYGYGHECESTNLATVDLVFQDDLIKCKQNFDVIMDDTFIHSTAEEHMDDLMDLFKVLRKYGLKLSPHKCQFFKKRIVCMGLEFQVQGDKVCYTPLKDKCDAIRNLESSKALRQTRAFCGMVNFLSSFLPNLRRLLILIYDLQKKAKKFKWTDEAGKAFNEIKKLLISPPVLKAPTPDGLFQLERIYYRHLKRRCGWYFTTKARRQMDSYWLPFQKTP